MDAIFKALADPTRREILSLLRNCAMTAGEIASHFTVSKPTLSGHFAVLRAADLIDGKKDGTSITYRLKASVLEAALGAFADKLALRGLEKKAMDPGGLADSKMKEVAWPSGFSWGRDWSNETGDSVFRTTHTSFDSRSAPAPRSPYGLS